MQLNRELTAQARTALRGHWGMAAVVTLVFALVVMTSQSLTFISSYLSGVVVLISWPLAVGYNGYWLRRVRGEETDLGAALTFGFKRFGVVLGVQLLYLVYAVGAALLFAPVALLTGILMPLSGAAALAVGLIGGVAVSVYFGAVVLNYILTPFLLAEETTESPRQVMRRSKALMHGYRLRFIRLLLRLIGWLLLAVLTCGIGLLWVFPYMTAAYAAFYDVRKAELPAPAEASAEAVPPYRMKPVWTVLLVLVIVGWCAGVQLFVDFSGSTCQSRLQKSAAWLTLQYDGDGVYREQPLLGRWLMPKRCPAPWGSEYLLTAPMVKLPADKAARGRTLLLLEYPGNHFAGAFHTVDGNGVVKNHVLPKSMSLLPYLELQYDLNDQIRAKIAEQQKNEIKPEPLLEKAGNTVYIMKTHLGSVSIV